VEAEVLVTDAYALVDFLSPLMPFTPLLLVFKAFTEAIFLAAAFLRLYGDSASESSSC
jgi:hypothetical protein|tara:strand:+ start:659 stop:832 length:174 start_codon:yes stop_codon:yes gene_type:complete